MTLLARIADRVIGRPCFVHPAKLELIASVLGDRIGVEAFASDAPDEVRALRSEKPAASRFIGDPVMAGRSELYRRVNGVGIIPIVGTLVNRGAFIGDDGSGFTSYEGIAAQVRAAAADPQVQAILLDIDSPGGEATGLFALAQLLRDVRAVKPITAVVDDMAASAAQGIAASATETVVSPTSITGSIGTVMLHIDRSGEMEMKGRKPTLIFAGEYKVDGSPLGPLSPAVHGRLQREVDTFNARFLESINAGRPSLTIDAIRGMKAGIFLGSEALDVGLADRVETFDQALSRLSGSNRARSQLGGLTMTNPTPAATDNIARSEHEAAMTAARAEARAEGERAGREAATARIRTILTCPEAKGRDATAMVFALDSDMASEVAAKALAASPVASGPKAALPALAERGAPPLPGGEAGGKPDAAASWDDVIAGVNAEIARGRQTRRQQ